MLVSIYQDYLMGRCGLPNHPDEKPSLQILTTDKSIHFEKFAIKMFNETIKPISIINI